MKAAGLTVDVGLTKRRCLVFADGGAILARATVPYPTAHPRPGWAE